MFYKTIKYVFYKTLIYWLHYGLKDNTLKPHDRFKITSTRFDWWTADYIVGHREEPEWCICIANFWYQCCLKLYSNITRILILYLRCTCTSQFSKALFTNCGKWKLFYAEKFCYILQCSHDYPTVKYWSSFAVKWIQIHIASSVYNPSLKRIMQCNGFPWLFSAHYVCLQEEYR